MSERARLVFLGSDVIALPVLNWLVGEGADRFELVAIYTQPDRPVGRGQKVQANGIKLWALERGLPVFQPEKLTEEVRQEFAAQSPDLALVMAYGHILRQAFIDTPRLGTLNLHASILPTLRGASPIQTAVATGERETGVSLMRIVRQLDAGPVADVERVPICPRDTALDVEHKLSEACVPLVRRALPRVLEGTLEFAEQAHERATFCRRLTKADVALDFAHATAAELAARINGLNPWPGSVMEIEGQMIKIGLADVASEQTPDNAQPGEILGKDDEGLLVATAQGVLRCLKLQRPGGRMLSAADYLRGADLLHGQIVPSVPMQALVASQPFPKY